ITTSCRSERMARKAAKVWTPTSRLQRERRSLRLGAITRPLVPSILKWIRSLKTLPSGFHGLHVPTNLRTERRRFQLRCEEARVGDRMADLDSLPVRHSGPDKSNRECDTGGLARYGSCNRLHKDAHCSPCRPRYRKV